MMSFWIDITTFALKGRWRRTAHWFRISRAGSAGLGFCVAAGLLPFTAWGATIKVPSMAPTIQQAVDIASEGDTVLVAAGEYGDYRTRTVYRPSSSIDITANVFLDKPVALVSEMGAEATLIQGSGLGPVIVCSMARGGRVEGFTIKGGDVDETLIDGGGGIYCEWSELDIRGNIIEENSGPFGGAIALFTGSIADIRENIVRNNKGDAFGGAIAVTDPCASTIEKNVIADNVAQVCGGGMFLATQSQVIVRDNTFVGNSALAGSAVFCREADDVIFANNIVAFGAGSGAVFCDTLGHVIPCVIAFSCNDFWENEGEDHAGCTAGPGDREVDPLFCSSGSGEYTLCVFSPSLGRNDGCGRRGALPASCWSCPAQERRLTWGLLKSRYR